jgi:hypothetical protein
VNRFLRVLPLLIATACAAVPILIAGPGPASAHHAWSNYHWARTSTNQFTLLVGDNVNSTWDQSLDEAINFAGPDNDWTDSPVLNLVKVPGNAKRNCSATLGRIEVCNARYGNNGWLGIAQIWISGSHITQGTTKLNDSYHNNPPYNTSAWRRLVTCQEIAHDFGLGHQDENFNNANLGSCMDYTSDPDGGEAYGPSNEHPNAHDFEQIQTIYTHLDSTTTIGSTIAPAPGRSGTAADEGPNNLAEFGRSTGHKDGYGRDNHFEKQLPDGRKMITHVFWAEPQHGGPAGQGRP